MKGFIESDKEKCIRIELVLLVESSINTFRLMRFVENTTVKYTALTLACIKDRRPDCPPKVDKLIGGRKIKV